MEESSSGLLLVRYHNSTPLLLNIQHLQVSEKLISTDTAASLSGTLNENEHSRAVLQ